MNKSIEELKIRARILQKSAFLNEEKSLRRLKKARISTTDIRLKHCLETIASELGFDSWRSAKDYISGTGEDYTSRGTFWYAEKCMVYLNHWFATYEEARSYVEEHENAFLLPYKAQYLVVDENYLKSTGMYDDCRESWQRIDRDLVEGYAKPEWHHIVWSRISASNGTRKGA